MDIHEIDIAARNNSLGLKRRHTEDSTYDYVGLAPAGAPLSENKWRIARVRKDNSDTDHPNGDGRFVHNWNDVLTYDYN